MNIIEAINSGKKYKRTCHTEWFEAGTGWTYCFSIANVLATDWQIEERKIELTESQVMRALKECATNEDVLKELGFL